MRSKSLLILIFLLLFGVALMPAQADNDAGNSAIRAPITVTQLIIQTFPPGGVVTDQVVIDHTGITAGSDTLLLGSNDTDGWALGSPAVSATETAGDTLWFELTTTDSVSRVTANGNSTPDIRVDIYDQYGSRTPTLVPFENYSSINAGAASTYKFFLVVGTDLLVSSGDINLATVDSNRYVESRGMDGLNDQDNLELYLSVTNNRDLPNGNVDVTTFIIAHNGTDGGNLGWDVEDFIRYDSGEPQLVPDSLSFTPSAPANYDVGTNIWTPQDCAETITYSIDVYDPYDTTTDADPNTAGHQSASTPNASGIDTSKAVFYIDGVAVDTSGTGAPVVGITSVVSDTVAITGETSYTYTLTLQAQYFLGQSGTNHHVTFTVPDSAGNLITFDGRGGADGTDGRLPWDGDSLQNTAGVDIIEVDLTALPQLTVEVRYPFSAAEGVGGVVGGTAVGYSAVAYPAYTVGGDTTVNVTTVPQYDWMDDNPTFDGTGFTDSSVANAARYYIRFGSSSGNLGYDLNDDGVSD
ncbi:MAG: hypothetical protein B6244_14070, partial [Candidatus Cloacimonetes bacterium 4572_55]